MIATVTQYGSMLVLRDQHGQQVGNMSISGGDLVGHSRDFVVIKYDNMYYTINENQQQLGNLQLDSSFRFQSVTDSGFTVRTGNMITSYDKYCRKIDSFVI